MSDLASAIDHLLKAKRISAPSQSYAKDNPAEYQKVKAYLDGGARPTGVTTEMGLGLIEVEDVRRAVTPPPPPPPDPGHGTLIFEDQFDTLRWDTVWTSGIWGYDTGNPGNEAQVYRRANATVSGGILSLTAKREDATTSWPNYSGKVFPYTSGMISSDPLQVSGAGFDFQYGYMEARIKIPSGRGLWPAFWCPPNSATPGEIDMMEILGHEPAKLHMNYHGSFSQGSSYTAPVSLALDYHIYGLDWRAGKLVWYLDNVERFRIENSQITSARKYLDLNLAVGGDGSWPGPPDASTVFPATMLVDWVKVWQ